MQTAVDINTVRCALVAAAVAVQCLAAQKYKQKCYQMPVNILSNTFILSMFAQAYRDTYILRCELQGHVIKYEELWMQYQLKYESSKLAQEVKKCKESTKEYEEEGTYKHKTQQLCS